MQRVAFLERENAVRRQLKRKKHFPHLKLRFFPASQILNQQLTTIKEDNDDLRKRLSRYETV